MTSVHEIGGPSSWRGPDMAARPEEWTMRFDAAQQAELLAALAAVESAGLDFPQITRELFVLPTVGPLLASIVDVLLDGRGFVLVQGVPIDGLDEHQIELLYWGMGLHVGIALPQGAAGSDLFAHVRDEGVDRNANYGGGLLNKHSGGLPFHTDSSDIVGLLCIRPAKSGGRSTIVSTTAVHDEIVRRRPDLAAVMYEPWWFDRKRGDGPDSFAQCPVYAVNAANRLFAFYGPDLYRTAQRGDGIPQLTEQQHEAMALIGELNSSPEFHLDMWFQSGEIQFINNYTVMHARSPYDDDPDPALRRDLIRLWLTIDRDLDIPEIFAERGLTSRSAAFAPAMVAAMGDGECRMVDVDRMPRRIEEWLVHVGRPGRVVRYELMTGGYSRTMARVDLEWADGSREVLVLRGDPPAELAMLESSREMEWALLSALTTIERVQTPLARWFVDDEAWFGSPAIFIEHAAGTTLQAQLDAGLDHGPATRRLSATLASIASVEPETVGHFPAMPDWDTYIDTQIARWRNLADTYVEALPIISYLAAWMDDNRPPPLPMRLVHGDPQAANILVSPTGEWNLVDWEFARIGDPREDLGYYNAYSGAVPPNLLAEDVEGFLAAYRDATGFDDEAVNPASLAWFTTLSTISVVQGMHDAIAGLANGTRSGTLVAFNSLLCTVGYAQFLGAIEMIEASSSAGAR